MTKLALLSVFFYSGIALAKTGRTGVVSSSVAAPAASPAFGSLLEKTLEQHPELKAFEKEEDAARKRSEETFWLGDTTVSVTRTGTETPLGSGASAQTEIGVVQNFSWPGKSHGLTRIARIDVSKTNLELKKKRRQIERQAALLYSQVLGINLKGNIARQKLISLGDAKRITARSVRSGLGTPIDDRLIEREIELTELQVDQLKFDKSQKIAEIETILPGAKMDISDEQSSALPRAYFQARSREASNLFLESASLDTDRSLAEMSLSKQSVWPDFSLGLLQKNERNYEVGVGLTIPLWYSFRQGKRVASASALSEASELRFDYQKRIAPIGESVLRARIKNLKSQFEAREKIARTISASTLKQSRTLFERGRIDWKQLQMTINALFEDQEKLVDLDLDLFSNQLEIFELSGVIE